MGGSTQNKDSLALAYFQKGAVLGIPVMFERRSFHVDTIRWQVMSKGAGSFCVVSKPISEYSICKRILNVKAQSS